MKIKGVYLILLTLLLSLGFNKVKATHYMGGEITWECMTGPNYTAAQQGRYRFHLKLYRECYISNGSAASTFGNTETLYTTVPGLASISMSLIGSPKDISPKCYSNTLNIKCTGMSNGAANMGAVQEYYYNSNSAYPNGVQLNGVPPASGWMFYNESCCRNPCTNISNASSLGYRLRAIMYPYNNMNAYPCFDNSPVFAEIPRTVICSGYPFTYNHNASDKELDALTFGWGQPLNSGGTAITAYTAGYSYTNPLPGPAQNVNNVAATINPVNGEISFTSFTNGAFVTSTKVTAFKCGIKVAEIWRDMQIVMLACPSNNPPTVTAPFPPNSYNTTVYAGDIVTFSMSATDFQFNGGTLPQYVSLEATGAQFGSYVPGSPATYSTSTGCLNPPCASLTPAPPYPNTNYPPLSAQFAVSTLFSWKTECQHLATTTGCGVTSNVYTFVIKAMDDYCPAPAIKISTIQVTVLPKPTLPSPPIQCVKVLPSGAVELNWTPVHDTMNTFNQYRIYSSVNPAGPYTLVDSVLNINSGTYTDLTANASIDPRYYYIRTKAGCPGIALESNAFDTVSTIDISVANLGNGGATLHWNPIRLPLLTSSDSIYKVYREYPTGVWTMVGTTMDTVYFDTATVCHDSLYYRVEIADFNLKDSNGTVSTCNSVSNIASDLFQDNTAPQIPAIDSVSVNSASNGVYIGWQASQNLDTKFYIVYNFVNGGWTPVDTLIGINNTLYLDTINDPCGKGTFLNYQIAAMDSCGNISAMSDPQNTMYLATEKAICDDQITLTWNIYNNMIGGLDHYEVWVSEENGPFAVIDTLSPTDTVFVHTGLTDHHWYCYFIKAVGIDGRTSSSCRRCEVADKPNQPQFSYIRSASVVQTNNALELTIHSDVNAKVTHYRIERNDNGIWNTLTTLPPQAAPTLSYTDVSAAVRQMSYTYRVVVVDSCGDDAMTSNIAKSVFLKVVANDDLTNTLYWSPYIQWSGTPTTFDIYRKVDGVLDINPVASGISAFTFIDNVENVSYSNGIFDYYVVAKEGAGNIYGFADEARSNEVRVFQKPKMFIPLAFNPTGNDNNVFLPKGVFANSSDYNLKVFNRWGQIMFETSKIDEGWNGTYKGDIAPMGVYTYMIHFTTSEGKKYERSGTFTLLK